MSAADFPMHPGIAGCAAFPSGMSLCGKKARSFPRICLLFPREVPDSYTVPVCSALPSVSSGLMIFLSVCPQACPRLFRFRSLWPAVAIPLPGPSRGQKKGVYSVAPLGGGRVSEGEAPSAHDGTGASSLCCLCGVFVQRFRLTAEPSKSQVLDRGGEGGGRPGGRSQRHLQPRATTCLPSSTS